MPNLNRVMLMGNLTRDPELRYTPNNTAVAGFGLAVNRRFKDGQGQMQEEVTFVDCDAWGRTAEVINQYLRKGNPIFVEGRLKLDQWQDKEGQKRSRLKVVVENFQFIDSRGGGEGLQEGGPPASQYAGRPPQQRPSASASTRPMQGSPPQDPHQSIGEEDIPF